MASIELDPRYKKGPNRRYRVRYRDPNGKQRTKGGFSTKKEAESWAATNRVAIDKHEWVAPEAGKVRYADWVSQWEHTWTNLRESTKERDRNYLRRYVLPHFGRAQLRRISYMAVSKWVADLSEDLAPATVQKAYQLLNKSLKGAVKAGLLAKNPADGVDLPKIEQTEMRFLTPEEVGRLADAMDPRYRALVWVAAYGGLRRGELFGLRRSRVNVLAATVEVAEGLVEVNGERKFQKPKTKSSRRAVPLPRFAAEELGNHLGTYVDSPSDALVFSSPEGLPMRASLFRRRMWLPAVEAADVAPLRMHDLRHTAVALWIAADVHIKEISRRAGHTRVAFTLDRYGHLLPGMERQGMDALDAMAREARGLSPTGTVTDLGGR